MKKSELIIVFIHVIIQIVESQKSPNYLREREQPGVDFLPIKGKIPAFKFKWDDPEPIPKPTYAALTIKLDCKIRKRGQPAIVQWYKNGQEITHKSNRTGASKEYRWNNKKKFIMELEESIPADEGNYSCLVTNQFGQVFRQFRVDVQARSVAQPPKIDTSSPGNFTVLVGQNLTLNCPIVNWDPLDPTEMAWLRVHQGQEHAQSVKYANGSNNFDLLQKCSSDGGMCLDPSGNWTRWVPDPQAYYFPKLALNDTGMYCCVAYTTWGSDHHCGTVTVVTSLPNHQAQYIKIIVGCAVSVSFLILVTIFVGFYARKQKSKREKTDRIARNVMVWSKRVMISMDGNNNGNNEESGGHELVPNVHIKKCRATPSTYSTDAIFSEYEYPCDPDWEFDRGKLEMVDVLGEGAFGLVNMAEAKFPNGELRTVAVKMLKEGHTDNDVIDLVKEMTIMKTIRHHDNIINLLGVCTQPMGHPLYVIVEYAKFGNLKNFLNARREGRPCIDCNNSDYLEPDQSLLLKAKKCDYACILSLENLLNMAWQVSKGMEFLCLNKCVHRDLAARNILVCENNLVKIADFGMARNVQETDYYRKNTEGKLPVKWMAPEAVFDRMYTSQSDVWSYGILLWEIMTMGESPFKDLHVEIFLEKLRNGGYPEKPGKCPMNVYETMQDCWKLQPSDRLTWPAIVDRMHTLCASAQPYKYCHVISIV